MLRVPRPSLVTRKLMLLLEPPVVIEPKLMALVEPSLMRVEPLKTAISGEDGGGVGVVTVPRTVKVMEVAPPPTVTDPLLLPAALVSMRMVKLALLCAAIVLGGALVKEKPEGTRTEPTDSFAVPSLRMVKVIDELVPRATLPKLTVDPLPIRLPPRNTLSL